MKVFYVTCVLLYTCYGKPAVMPGPCVGPDCFHGQLMHGDKEEGLDHNGEDTYLRIKDDLAAGKEPIKPDTPTDLGVGQMHIDIGAQGKEDVEAGPIQPVDGENLLHNGEEHGHQVKEDTDEVQGIGEQFGPGGDEYWHGVINHGDTEPGKDHHHEGEEKQPVKYDFDVEDIMALGDLDQLLSKVDLNAMLKRNNDEYANWKENEEKILSESGNIWEQIERVRQRYLTFGKQEVEDEQARANRLNPMLSEWEPEEGGGDWKSDGEDDIIHGLEMAGNTAPKRSIHKNNRRDL